MPETQASKAMEPKVHFIGVGKTGIQILKGIHASNELPDATRYTAVDTDAKLLESALGFESKYVGGEFTRGLGTQCNPALGQKIAQAKSSKLEALVKDLDALFIVAGLGGGSGGPLAVQLADIAEQSKMPSFAFVTLPFAFEEAQRLENAKEALGALNVHCNAILTMPNELLLKQSAKNANALEALSVGKIWALRAASCIYALLKAIKKAPKDFKRLQETLDATSGQIISSQIQIDNEHKIESIVGQLESCPFWCSSPPLAQTKNAIAAVLGDAKADPKKLQELKLAIKKRFKVSEKNIFTCLDGSSTKQNNEFSVLRVHYPEPMSQKTAQAATSPKSSASAFKLNQEEFGFTAPQSQRGYFSTTQSNCLEGEELDTPSYLRRKIRINL